MADTDGITVSADNTNEILNALTLGMQRALNEIGMTAEAYAKQECPVDTGRLRNSITYQVSNAEKSVYIGTNVEYAPYVELGTDRQKAHPYLRPAAHNHGEEYRKILRKNLVSF